LMALPGLVLIAIVYTFIGMLLLNGG
jgi:hypothetical protein